MHKALILLGIVSLLSGCGEGRKPPVVEPPREPLGFSDSMFDNITPMIDGSVYAADFNGRLWHVKDAHAVPVKATAGELPEFHEIVPCADGSAYAPSWEGGMWHLVGATATKASESKQASSGVHPSSDNKGFFALYAHERQRRIAAEDRAEETEQASKQDRDDG
jgi:hypothetical protein